MTMFGARPLNPMMLNALQAALAGQVPGVIGEGGMDPRMLAQSVGAPVPMAPGGAPSAAPVNNDPGSMPPARDPRGLAAPRGGVGVPAMPMGDLPPQGMASAGDERQPYGGILNPQDARAGMVSLPQTNGMFAAGPKQHKGLFPGKDWKTWVGQILPAALAGFTASQGNPAGKALLDNMLAMQRKRQEMYEPFTVGNSVVQRGEDGGFSSLYTAPQPFEQYAAALGYQPGTPEYADAVENYRLGAWSDPAMQAKLGLTGYRYDRQAGLQEDRQDYGRSMQEDRQTFSNGQLTRRLNQSDLNNRRTTGVSRENNIRTTSQSNTNNIRTTDTSRANNQATNDTRLRTARKVRALPNEPVAVGPGGKRMVVRNGKWVEAD